MSCLTLRQQIFICKTRNQFKTTNFHIFLFSIIIYSRLFYLIYSEKARKKEHTTIIVDT
nr:MAG TPA: hypothetical protein [Caudoviricetes sp.]